MAPPVYSTQFIAETVFTDDTGVTYVVPAGFIAVIVDVSIAVNAPANTGFPVGVGNGLSGFFYQIVPPGFTGALHWRGRQVCPPGGEISANCQGSGSACDVGLNVAGYLLTAP